MSNNICDSCGCSSAEDSDEVLELASCDACGTYCAACLAKTAVESGWLTQEQAQEHMENFGAAGFIRKSERSEYMLCPECYRKENGI